MATTRNRLTQRHISAAKPSAREYTLWDSQVSGFGFRIRPTGAGTYIYVYRNLGGKSRRYKIGKADQLTVDQARKKARELAYRVTKDEDPAASKTLARKTTVESVYAEYEIHRISEFSLGHKIRVRGIFRSIVIPQIGHMPIGTVSQTVVRSLTEKKILTGKGGMANNIHRVVSAFLSWCHIYGDYLNSNPLQGIRPPSRRKSRSRVLHDHELATIWRACPTLNSQWSAATRLLMLTGMRKTEVLGAKLREINLARNEWTVPEIRTKNRHAHTVHLSPLAVEIIKGIPGHQFREYLFQSEVKIIPKSIAETTASIRKLKKLVSISDWRIHDLRRSVATHMASLGVAPHIIQVILNHRSGFRNGVTAIYNRYAYAKEAKAAWELWSMTLAEWV